MSGAEEGLSEVVLIYNMIEGVITFAKSCKMRQKNLAPQSLYFPKLWL